MKEKTSKESLKKEKHIEEKDEEILYEKLIIMGDKNVGKLSLINNIFSQDYSNIITPGNEKLDNNISNENKNSGKKEKINDNNNNNNKKEENKKESIKIKEDNEKSKENKGSIKTEKKEIKQMNNGENNNNIINREENVIIYEKKISMKNGSNKMKDFQIFVTSFCDNNLIHSLSFMCQCILILFDVKNKTSFENAKKIIEIMESELKNKNKYKLNIN